MFYAEPARAQPPRATLEIIPVIKPPYAHLVAIRPLGARRAPSGYQETLNCAGYNHNWVQVYHYEDDAVPLLPKGTVIKVTAWYDNTASNPRFADPRNWKGWGSRSIDDMLFLLSRVIWLTEEEYQAEAEARGIVPVVHTSFAREASSLDVSEVTAFIGMWTLSLESDRGPFAFRMDIKDLGGKVAATLNSDYLGESKVTDITRDGDDLNLRWDADLQGQIVPLTLTLTPDGDQLKAMMDFAGFAQMDGVATK